MRSQRAVLAVLLALALVLGACANDEESEVATGGAGDAEAAPDADDGGSGDATTTSELTEIGSDDLAGLSNVLSEEVPVEVERCVLEEILTSPDLSSSLAVANDTDVTELPLDEQLALFEVIGDCAGPDLLGEVIGEELASDADLPLSPELSACLAEAMIGEDGPLVMAGFAGIDTPAGIPPEARDPLIDTLSECIPGSTLGEVMVSELAADPTLAGMIDDACVQAAYSNDTDVRPLWEAFVDMPDANFDQLPPEATAPILEPILGCVSFGQMVATQLGTTGGELSTDSIACIDNEVAESDLLGALLTGGEPDEAELTAILFECLTAEELGSLVGASG